MNAHHRILVPTAAVVVVGAVVGVLAAQISAPTNGSHKATATAEFDYYRE